MKAMIIHDGNTHRTERAGNTLDVILLPVIYVQA
jgi:hypothetical protein